MICQALQKYVTQSHATFPFKKLLPSRRNTFLGKIYCNNETEHCHTKTIHCKKNRNIV
jgi:hypothetical protein